ncbi:unnamed protein product [Gadus morhua 'NCC']
MNAALSSEDGPQLLAVFYYDYDQADAHVGRRQPDEPELNKWRSNLALSDAKGHDLEKRDRGQHSLESKQGGGGLSLEAVPEIRTPSGIRCAAAAGQRSPLLQSLAFRIPLESSWRPLGEEDILIDPSELLGRRLDFQLILGSSCAASAGSRAAATAGCRWVCPGLPVCPWSPRLSLVLPGSPSLSLVLLSLVPPRSPPGPHRVPLGPLWSPPGPLWSPPVPPWSPRPRPSQARFFECGGPLYTPARLAQLLNRCWTTGSTSAAPRSSQRLLDHLQSSALVLELWGLQEGCTELTTSLDGVTMTSEGIFIIDGSAAAHSATPTSPAELSSSLRTLQEELEALRCSNSSLKKENHSLREQLLTAKTEVRLQAPPPPTEPGEESEQLGLRLFVDEQGRLLKDFSEQLELCVSSLKQDVAAIVRRKRERSGIWS